MLLFSFALLVSGNALEESLIQAVDGKLYQNKTETVKKFEEIADRLKVKGGVIGLYNASKIDPDHGSYYGAGVVADVDSKLVEPFSEQGKYSKIPATDIFLTAGPSTPTNPGTESGYWKQWPPKAKTAAAGGGTEAYTNKFLTQGKIDYGWKFHEKTEKQYTKEVKAVNAGNLTELTDTTNASFKNKNEKVKVDATTQKDTNVDAKVFKGKKSEVPTLLQTKAMPYSTEDKTVTKDVGYQKKDITQGTSQEGSVGKGSSKESGTYTQQEGQNTVSLTEKPKVTAKKSGTVDVDWRGGDSYTTSKMMHGMKKFIKRAARGEKW
jgi:hypothetical protein